MVRRGGLRHQIRIPMVPGYLGLHEALDKHSDVEVRTARGLVGILGHGWDRRAVVTSGIRAARTSTFELRTMIRPGVTGWAQVRHGYANNLEEETDKMRFDLDAIKRVSLWVDLRILLDTVKIVFLGHSAATVATRPGDAQPERSLPELNRAA